MSYAFPVWNSLVTRAGWVRYSDTSDTWPIVSLGILTVRKWGKIPRNWRPGPHNSFYERLRMATTTFWRIWIDHYVKLWFVAFKLQNLLHILARRKSQLVRMASSRPSNRNLAPAPPPPLPSAAWCANFSQPQIIFLFRIYMCSAGYMTRRRLVRYKNWLSAKR